MTIRIPPPPNGTDITTPAWRDWFYRLASALSQVTTNVESFSSGASFGIGAALLGSGECCGDAETTILLGIPSTYQAPPPSPCAGAVSQGPVFFPEDAFEEPAMYPASAVAQVTTESAIPSWVLSFAAAHS